MKITRDSLHEVIFENQDARLLIEDVVTHTSANLYYYHGMEISVRKALDIWYKAMAADEEEERREGFASVAFFNYDGNKSRSGSSTHRNCYICS